MFSSLDGELPLALFPVRLEARFLPDREPTEIVVRIFPDEIHADTHDPALSDVELALAQAYWDAVWRSAAEPQAVAEARRWLAAELGPHRALYVAAATRPEGEAPTAPTPEDEPLDPAPELPEVARRERAGPGKARLMPVRWLAFVEVGGERYGPFWAAQPVAEELAVTPALVELPEDADVRAFLDAQGLAWTHDLAAAEQAGLAIRIPIAALPERPHGGYDRLLVLGAAAGSDHGESLETVLEAHRYSRGLDFLPPGTATNVSEDAPEGAGAVPVDALFASELDAEETGRWLPGPKRRLLRPEELLRAAPADALALAFGLGEETAADRALFAGDPAAELALAANRALWPATWGYYLSGPMRWANDGTPLLAIDDLDWLRAWFTDYVRPDGPLPTLRVGRQPYGLLPVRELGPLAASRRVDHLENLLVDLFDLWLAMDAIPTLDPDASDTVPDPDQAAEQASDVGAIYGATPHHHEIRLRPVDDTQKELSDLYGLRLGVLGLLCAVVPKDFTADGEPILATPEDLDTHPWYQVFAEHEAAARGADGVAGQIDALRAMRDDLDAVSGYPAQEVAAFRAMKYIDRFARHHETGPEWPPDDEIPSGDLLGLVSRQQGRVADAQPYLAALGARDHLGAERAPRLYGGAYGLEDSELAVEVLVAAETSEAAASELAAWLGALRDDVAGWENGGDRPSYDLAEPAPLLRQLLRSAATTVAAGEPATALRRGLDALVDLVAADDAAAIPVLERLLRAALGPATYRVDAWITSLASRRLADQRLESPSGIQIGGYGWLVGLEPRAGKASQGHIHAPSLDHAVTAAVLRSGWSAFGTAQGESPLAVDLSAPRIRAARSLIEGVRGGQELGRLLGARFERRLHDRALDDRIDNVRAAVLAGSGDAGQPPTRIVDGLLLARAFSQGVEPTPTETAVLAEVEPLVLADPELATAVDDTVGDLDALADVLLSQAVHGLLRGDAGVAAPTLAATGSGDAGLPAIDFPATLRGGSVITIRVLATFGETPATGGEAGWPGGATSLLAVAEPRLEAWVAGVLGPPDKVIAEIAVGGTDGGNGGDGTTQRLSLAALGIGALDAVYRAERLGADLLETALGSEETAGAELLPGRPEGLAGDHLGLDELVAVAGTVRALLGRIRALRDADFATGEAVPPSWDVAELGRRVDDLRPLIAAGDPRLEALAEHEAEHPAAGIEELIDRLHLLTGEPMPILPLIAGGVPQPVRDSFAARAGEAAGGGIGAWLAQAAKVRPAVRDLLTAVQLGELVQARALLSFALAQSPDEAGGPWAGLGAPAAGGTHTGWCSLTGAPDAGPVAGFVVDAWTETIPERRATTGIAVHFDRPSAVAPNAVLLMMTRAGEAFDLDYVVRCLSQTLTLAHFRAMGPDTARAFLGHYLPGVFLPGETAIETLDGEETA